MAAGKRVGERDDLRHLPRSGRLGRRPMKDYVLTLAIFGGVLLLGALFIAAATAGLLDSLSDDLIEWVASW
jgi:hypothetical protein